MSGTFLTNLPTMKRVGHLIEKIAELDNLHEAFLRAARGKRDRAVVMDYGDHLDENLQRLREELLAGEIKCGGYNFFTIYDPKQRTICAASFHDRVLFHAIMRVCHKVFDDYQVYDSYASRVGKGTYKALERVQHYCCRYQWFAKLDVKKYFDSIDHKVMMSQLDRLFKDPVLLHYFEDLLCSYEVEAGKGVPIGNLTSQYFANHYLSVADHYAKEQLRVKGFVRYMDDVLFFDDNLFRLKEHVAKYQYFVKSSLKLQMHDAVINRTSKGIPFLGYVAYGNKLRLNGRSVKRLQRKMSMLNLDLSSENIEQKEYAARATALLAFAQKAQCHSLLRKMSRTKGMYPQGL